MFFEVKFNDLQLMINRYRKNDPKISEVNSKLFFFSFFVEESRELSTNLLAEKNAIIQSRLYPDSNQSLVTNDPTMTYQYHNESKNNTKEKLTRSNPTMIY